MAQVRFRPVEAADQPERRYPVAREIVVVGIPHQGVVRGERHPGQPCRRRQKVRDLGESAGDRSQMRIACHRIEIDVERDLGALRLGQRVDVIRRAPKPPFLDIEQHHPQTAAEGACMRRQDLGEPQDGGQPRGVVHGTLAERMTIDMRA